MTIITLSLGGSAQLKDFVSMRLKHELQKLYLSGSELNAQGTPTTVGVPATVVLEAQDLAVKSLVQELKVGDKSYTQPEEILEQILDLPAQDGEKIFAAVNQLLSASSTQVPKV